MNLTSFVQDMTHAGVDIERFEEVCQEVASTPAGASMIRMITQAYPPTGDDFISDSPVLAAFRGGRRSIVAALCKFMGKLKA